MDLKTYIRACALFTFNQGKNITVATRFICELYPEDAMTQQTLSYQARTVVCQIQQKGDWSLLDLPRTGLPQILDRQSFKTAEDAD